MTEIERIIKKGVINEDYLKEEVICDFLVTSDRKKLFAVLIDMFIEFDRICKKHKLRYYLDGIFIARRVYGIQIKQPWSRCLLIKGLIMVHG